jgi:hypothetical protein
MHLAMRCESLSGAKGSGTVRMTLALAAGLLLSAGPAWAGPDRIDVELMVSHISESPDGSAEPRVDPRARKLDRQLRSQFRYDRLRVLDHRVLHLRLNEVGSMKLPNGHRVQIRPLLVDENGVLLAVDVEDTLDTDMRIQSDHMVVIGADRHEDGKLVISLEPHF